MTCAPFRSIIFRSMMCVPARRWTHVGQDENVIADCNRRSGADMNERTSVGTAIESLKQERNNKTFLQGRRP